MMTHASTLTTTELRRLTAWKWQYSLESAGFTAHQAQHILFLRYLHTTRRVQP